VRRLPHRLPALGAAGTSPPRRRRRRAGRPDALPSRMRCPGARVRRAGARLRLDDGSHRRDAPRQDPLGQSADLRGRRRLHVRGVRPWARYRVHRRGRTVKIDELDRPVVLLVVGGHFGVSTILEAIYNYGAPLALKCITAAAVTTVSTIVAGLLAPIVRRHAEARRRKSDPPPPG